MPSTTATGDELRDHVLASLEADGHRVTREPRVRTKKVDILLHLEDEFHPRTVAIECKNLARTISQRELSEIFSDHLALVSSGKLTEVWVVSRSDFSPEAKQWADEQAGFHVFTVAEFEERRHGFRTYVRQTSGLFRENGLHTYYVPQRLVDGSSLSGRVSDWIASDDGRPLALLGGYGMGKTSFCHFLVDDLSRRYLADPLARVPIYVRLSDIAKEQDLDGLIAKTLAQRYRVNGYHFSKFQHLNRAGKFVIVFDGFDEMKHALSWGEFKYNFSEINRTVEGRAKVIVAGRPNAFLSDDEHNWALRGVQAGGERLRRIPGAPEYVELEMSPFSDEDARLFLSRYLAHHIVEGRPVSVLTDDDRAWIAERIAAFDGIGRRAELLRPVHLRIFAEIARDRAVELRDFSVHELYEIATGRIVERDAAKPQRARVDGTARQDMIEDIAWWLWDETEGRSLSFNPARVPMSTIRKAFPAGGELTDEAMAREILSGSFLERKHGDYFYFAHRSFLEFFVAKRLARARLHGIPLRAVNRTINPEIMTFIADGGGLPAFLDYVVEQMDRFDGDLDQSLLSAVRVHLAGAGGTRRQAATDLVLAYLFIYEDDFGEPFASRLLTRFRADIGSGSEERKEAALYFLADALRRHASHPAARPVAEAVGEYCAGHVRWPYWHRRLGEEATMPKMSFTRRSLPEWIFLRSARVAAETDREGMPVLVLDVDILFNDLFTVRKPRIVVTGGEPATREPHATVRMPLSGVLGAIAPQARAAAVDVLRRGVNARVGP